MTWVNYRQLREELRIEDIIAHYDIELSGTGDQRKCVCPFEGCDSGGKPSMSINTKKNLWKCWACNTHGNLIDLVARCEGLDPLDTKQFRKAALIVQERHKVVPDKPEQNGKRRSAKSKPAKKAPGSSRRQSSGGRRKRLVNEPLDFELKGLDPEHKAIESLGLSAETIEHFGLGYCTRPGMLHGRIAAPIYDAENQLVGYAGRLRDPDDAGPENPLWKLPDQERTRKRDNAVLVFDPGKLVYHAHTIEDPVMDLLVVDDLSWVWHLYEQEVGQAVAVLGGVSCEQVELICERADEYGCVWFLTGPGEPVQSLIHVAKERRVRWMLTEGQQDLEQHMQEIFY